MHPSPLKFLINTKFSDETLPRATYSEHHQYSWGEMQQRAQCRDLGEIHQLFAIPKWVLGERLQHCQYRNSGSSTGGGFVEEMKQQSLLCKETPVRSGSWCAQTGISKKERKGEEGERGQEGKEKKEDKRKTNKKKQTQKDLKLHSQRQG